MAEESYTLPLNAAGLEKMMLGIHPNSADFNVTVTSILDLIRGALIAGTITPDEFDQLSGRCLNMLRD